MSRILSRRADGARPEEVPADQPTVVVPASSDPPASETAPVQSTATGAAEPAGVQVPGAGSASGEQATVAADAVHPDAPAGDPTVALAAAEADPSLPAGAEPVAPDAPSFRDRGRLRRRLRYLRRVREIAFRDLGGLVFDLERFGRERPDLVQMKLDGLKAIDAELRRLEIALDDVRAVEELEEPGLAACSRCGALHGSDANFCPACGTATGDRAEVPAEEPAASAPPADDPPAADAPPA